MSNTHDPGKTGASPSTGSFKPKHVESNKPGIDKSAEDSATRAGDRMKKNEAAGGQFTK